MPKREVTVLRDHRVFGRKDVYSELAVLRGISPRLV